MRVLVCGGRGYSDAERVCHALECLAPSLVIHGASSGADRIAGRWAIDRGVPSAAFEASWDFYRARVGAGKGNPAGPIRNASMLKFGQPDLVLAFPGDRGTADMVRKAEAAGIEVRKIGWG